MLTFKEYVLQEAMDTKTGNYVSIGAKFPDLVDKIDIDTEKKNKSPHITLMYSTDSSLDKDELEKFLNTEFKDNGIAEVIKAEKFDSDEKDSSCIVLTLKSPALDKIHNALKEFGDLKHSYSDFKPHLTLFYDVQVDVATYWVDYINRNLKKTFIPFKGFESTTIIKDWNK